MNMKDVKAISIPVNGVDKNVDKIEDANGNVIWGSQTAFPYRRLEYIEANGKQAFDTGVNCARNSYMKLTVEDTGSVDCPMGRGSVGNNQRFAAGFRQVDNISTFRFGIGSGWLDGTTASSGQHIIGVQGPECNVLNNKIGTSDCKQGYYIDGTFTQNSNTFPWSGWASVYLFGSRGNAAGEIQEPCKCRIYYAEYGYARTDNYEHGYNGKFYPAQRKSDGKLGFYDAFNHSFLSTLVSGSDSNTLTAGPVADEYWDLTDPA